MESISSVSLKSAVGVSTILGVKGIGPVAAHNLFSTFDTIKDLLLAAPETMKGLVNETQRRNLQEEDKPLADAWDEARRQRDMAERSGTRMLSMFDDDYPRRLAAIPSPPPVLYVRGDISSLDASVAFVGTRECSDWAYEATFRMAAHFAEHGWTIVSGMAAGIDSAAHDGALSVNAPTAAVLGQGLDMFYGEPVEYIRKIEAAGGLVVTEQPFGSRASQSTYIRRNRIITGLSLSTFFMQGEIASGSMHSVKYAVQQGRPVLVPAIPTAQSDDQKNQTAKNLARLSPQEFSLLLDAQGALKEALEAMEHPTVATAVAGRRDYPVVIGSLERALSEHYSNLAPLQEMAMAG